MQRRTHAQLQQDRVRAKAERKAAEEKYISELRSPHDRLHVLLLRACQSYNADVVRTIARSGLVDLNAVGLHGMRKAQRKGGIRTKIGYSGLMVWGKRHEPSSMLSTILSCLSRKILSFAFFFASFLPLSGLTPLHALLLNEYSHTPPQVEPVVRILLRYGAKRDAPSAQGKSEEEIRRKKEKKKRVFLSRTLSLSVERCHRFSFLLYCRFLPFSSVS